MVVDPMTGKDFNRDGEKKSEERPTARGGGVKRKGKSRTFPWGEGLCGKSEERESFVAREKMGRVCERGRKVVEAGGRNAA